MASQSDSRKERTHNSTFAIGGVSCSAESLVQGGSLLLRMKFSAKTPRHRKPPKRYVHQEILLITRILTIL